MSGTSSANRAPGKGAPAAISIDDCVALAAARSYVDTIRDRLGDKISSEFPANRMQDIELAPKSEREAIEHELTCLNNRIIRDIQETILGTLSIGGEATLHVNMTPSEPDSPASKVEYNRPDLHIGDTLGVDCRIWGPDGFAAATVVVSRLTVFRGVLAAIDAAFPTSAGWMAEVHHVGFSGDADWEVFSGDITVCCRRTGLLKAISHSKVELRHLDALAQGISPQDLFRGLEGASETAPEIQFSLPVSEAVEKLDTAIAKAGSISSMLAEKGIAPASDLL